MFNAPSDGPRSPLLRGLVLFCATAGIIGISAAAAALYFSIPQQQAQPVQEEVTEERGPPDVAAHAPSSNAEDVPVGQNITIVFDRPMVPLTQVQGEPASSLWSSWPVRIEPAVKGEWRWISTYAAQFTASDGLMPATLYTVTVPQGLESSSGEKTETDVVWRFETERPAILRTEPEAGTASAVGPLTPLVLHFNQEMDLESLGKHLTLTLNAPGTSSGVSLRIASLKLGTKEEKGKKVRDPLAVLVSPADRCLLIRSMPSA